MSSLESSVKIPLGVSPTDQGFLFRVWVPHAKQVSVVGTFNDWNAGQHPLQHDETGHWTGRVEKARFGDEYRYHLETPHGTFTKNDPYARQVTSSVGNSIIFDTSFEWGETYHPTPSWNEWVIYELHVGSFNDTRPDVDLPGTFSDVIKRFGHLKTLGVNCIQVMPIAEFAGDRSWGYNPAHPFAVEGAYGGPLEFKKFVKAAHEYGLAVIIDVVYNHFGPSDLDLWRFDGWHEHDGGGIYFYQDWRKQTPWGDSRPDYGRPEVRQYIIDNANMWIEEYHVDGLRMDMTLYIRSVRSDGEANLPDGWTLLQAINTKIHDAHPNTITIAEDLQKSDILTMAVEHGGAGFSSQWDDQFVHPIREAVIAAVDEHRSMDKVAHAITHRYNHDAFQRVIYSESHDEVANGRARVPYEIDPNGSTNYFAQKRSTLAAALVFTSPGIPMLFQGQEFLEGEWFRDNVPLDWDRRNEFRGVVRLYRDLIHLRLNRRGLTRGLCGQNVAILHVNDQHNMIAFHRWFEGGPGDDVVVICNFHSDARRDYQMAFPSAGLWKLHFNSDWKGYSESFHDFLSSDVEIDASRHPTASIAIAGYSCLIYAKA